MALDETMTFLSSSHHDRADDGSHEMSRLSMEGFDADHAEVEFSDDKDGKVEMGHSSDDSGKEETASSSSLSLSRSLPATPLRRRMRGSMGLDQLKEYADARKCGLTRSNCSGGFNTENEGSGGGNGSGSGMVVITRPKGGHQSLCMDLEEVKACRDLGFELEHQRTVELPSSSGGDWHISSPGDDPSDVKARLKTWAQEVALASAARHRFS